MAELVVFGATHTGMIRDHNEDNLAHATVGDVHLVIVADGMGGHAGGQVASRLAVDTIREAFERLIGTSDPMTAITAAVAEANTRIRAEADADGELHGMGATCVVAAVRDDLLYYTHLGDCRLYLVREGKIIQLTRDHTMVQRLVDYGIIPAEAARFHPDKNIVSRALGGSVEVELDDPLEPVVLREGDRFILCSDGLFDLVSDDEVLETVLDSDPAEVCDALIALANEAGGRDNVTVQVGSYILKSDYSSSDSVQGSEGKTFEGTETGDEG
jgi:protein phosphatase